MTNGMYAGLFRDRDILISGEEWGEGREEAARSQFQAGGYPAIAGGGYARKF